MPIDKIDDRGTEKNGQKSELYCKYCYKDGAFTNPEMTLEQMKKNCEDQLKQQNIPSDILVQSLTMLPLLKRWNNRDKGLQ